MYVHESCLVPGMELGSPALQTYSLLSEPLWVWACFIYSIFPTKRLSFCLHKLSLILATIELLWQNNVGKAPAAAAAKSLQPCLTLRPHRHSPPGSAVPGMLQARTLEWVAIFFSNAWNWKVKVRSLSRVQLFQTPWTAAYQAPPSLGFSRQEYWSGLPLPSLVKHVAHSNWQLTKTTVYTFFRAVGCMCNIFSFPGDFLSLPHMQTEQ